MSRSVRRQLKILALVAAIAEQLDGAERAQGAALEDLVRQLRAEVLELGNLESGIRTYARELAALQARVRLVYESEETIYAVELLNTALWYVCGVVELLEQRPGHRPQRLALWRALQEALQALVEARDPELTSPYIESGSVVARALAPVLGESHAC